MLAIKILYKYLDFRNLITLLFFCMVQGLEFRWIWAILGQISKNSEIKTNKQDLCYYLGSALTLKKVQHCKNYPFIQILACFVPYIYYYYLLSFCPWEKEKNLMIRNVFFHSNSFEENTLNFPPYKTFFVGLKKPWDRLENSAKFLSRFMVCAKESSILCLIYYESIYPFYPFATKEREKSLFLVAFATNMMMI